MQNDLISRSKLLEVLEAAAGTAPEGQVQTAMLIREKLAFATGVVKQAEAVDAVPVVRCNDCENWDRDWEPSSGEAGTHFCPILGIITDPDFYCKNGERRKDHATD